MSFGFAYPYASIEEPSTPSPPPMPAMDFTLDPSFLGLDWTSGYAPYTTPDFKPQTHGHTRSSSRASVYSAVSTVESTPDSVCTRMTTPPRASPPIIHHGPILLPKIRSQDQDVDAAPSVPRHNAAAATAAASSVAPVVTKARTPRAPVRPARVSHARSYTNPETLNNMAFAHMSFSTSQQSDDLSNTLLCSPASFAHDTHAAAAADGHNRRSSSVDAATLDRYGYPTYRQMPYMQADLSFPSYATRAPSPLSMAAAATASVTPDPTPNTTLMTFLTSSNPAASLVRTVNFPHRDPHAKHFWWDVRSVRSWTGFNAASILSLPAASVLSAPVPAPTLPQPSMSSRHPETESALHSIYASYYLPKLNSALALGSSRPLQISVPSATKNGINDLLFTVNPAGESSTAAAMFGGKPTARVVGLVRTFDRFNTGMRVEGNIKRVEYLRGLAALHHAMREHGCRYGFILTEIELVLVRNGTESTPFFGDLEVTSVQLAATAANNNGDASSSQGTQLTACLALWGLCQLANDQPAAGHAHWKSEIGAPAEGTRRKAKPRDSWMPAPQLAEKRESKRSRGWVLPEDAVGRKELGKRGVRYNGM